MDDFKKRSGFAGDVALPADASRIGGASSPNEPSSNYINGSVGDVALPSGFNLTEKNDKEIA